MPDKASSPIHTHTAMIWLSEEGIVRAQIHPGEQQTLADAKANLGACIGAGGAVKRPLLIDIRNARMLDPEARHYYAGKALEEHFTKLGILLQASPLGVMMGNIYSRIARHKVPMKLFQDEAQAKAWLLN